MSIRYKYAQVIDQKGKKQFVRYVGDWRYDFLTFLCSQEGATCQKCDRDDLRASFGRPKRNGSNIPFAWRRHANGFEFCIGHEGLPTPAPKAQGKPHAVKSLTTSYLVGSGTPNKKN